MRRAAGGMTSRSGGTVCSKDQPRMGYLVERPDRTLNAGIGDAAIIARERRVAIGVEHQFRNRPEGGHEMIGGLEQQNPLACRLDAKVADELQAQRLRAVADEDDVDTANAYRGAVTEGDLGGTKALPGIPGKTDHGHLRIERLTGGGAGLATQTQSKAGPDPGIKAKFDGHRVPD